MEFRDEELCFLVHTLGFEVYFEHLQNLLMPSSHAILAPGQTSDRKDVFLRYFPKMLAVSRTNDLLAIWSQTAVRALREGQYIHECTAK